MSVTPVFRRFYISYSIFRLFFIKFNCMEIGKGYFLNDDLSRKEIDKGLHCFKFLY